MFSGKKYILFILIFVMSSVAGNSSTSTTVNEALIKNLVLPLTQITLRFQNYEDVSNDIIKFFLHQSVIPIKVVSYDFAEKNQSRNNVITTVTSELRNVMEKFSTRLGTQFFVMEREFDPNSTIVIDNARSIYKRKGIFKFYFLTADKVYYFNPYLLTSLGKYGALKITTHWRDFDRIFLNLNRYPLRTYIFRSVYSSLVVNNKTKQIEKAEGPDAEVAYSVEKLMNCTLILAEPDDAFFGHHLENGSYDGAIGKAVRYETDAILTGFFVKNYFSPDIEFSVTIYTDKLCCYTAKAKRIPPSILPLFAVKIDMWVGFIGAAFFWTAIWIAFRKFNLWMNRKRGRKIPQELKKYDFQYWRIFSDTWVIWVKANVCQYPPFSSEKIFVISLCLVSVIFGAIFESSLATVYINPLYYNDINTMQELDESQLKIQIKHAAMKDDLFFGSSSKMFQRLHSKLVFSTDQSERAIEYVARTGGAASVTRASSLLLDDIDYILSNKIHQIPECPKKYHIAYVFPKELPMKNRINDILLRFTSFGLINHWIEMMLHEARIGVLKSPEILKVMGGYRWKVLTIKDLQLGFYALVGGSIISAMVLIGEIYIAKKRSRK